MSRTKTNKTLLIIGSFLLMIALAFIPMFSASPKSVSAEAKVSVELSDDQKTITVTVSGVESAPTVLPTVALEQSETSGAAGTPSDFEETVAGSKKWKSTIALTNPDSIGIVKITVTIGEETIEKSVTVNIQQLDWYKGTVAPIINIMNSVVPILLILIGTAGAIFIVILGVNYSKAEDSSKREDAKKRLVGAVIGIVLTIALLIIIFLFTKNAPSVIRWIKGI